MIDVDHLLVKSRSNVRSVSFLNFYHLWTDLRIPDPVSCRCTEPRVGLLETPPRWHATIYTSALSQGLNHCHRGSINRFFIKVFLLLKFCPPPPSKAFPSVKFPSMLSLTAWVQSNRKHHVTSHRAACMTSRDHVNDVIFNLIWGGGVTLKTKQALK